MRVAPSVVVDLQGSRRWRAGVQLLGAGAAVCAALAIVPHAGLSPVSAGLLLALSALAGVAALRPLALAGVGRLAWDGAQWRLRTARGAEVAGSLNVMIDLGRWMLLRLDVPTAGSSARARPVWIPVSEGRVAEGRALRPAVYCRPLNTENAPSPGPSTR